jgi:hypothetical protein
MFPPLDAAHLGHMAGASFGPALNLSASLERSDAAAKCQCREEVNCRWKGALMTASRNTFAFVFTATIAGVLLIVFGLIGYTPPAHMSLAAETWRLGTWTDGVVLAEVALGTILVSAGILVAMRLNRSLPGR